MLGDTLGDGNGEGDLGLKGLLDTGGGKGRAMLGVSWCLHGSRCLFGRTDGTKIHDAVAPVSLTASETLPKTGRSRWVLPAFLGLVPPTTWVPVAH